MLRARNQFLFVIIWLTSCTWVMAQTPESRELTYHISFLTNNGIRPGLNLGVEYGLYDLVKMKSKVKRGKGAINMIKVHQVIAGLNTGVIWHPETSVSSLNTLTIEYRKTTKRRMQWQLGFGGAYMRSFFPNTYAVFDDDEVSSTLLGSSGYFGPTSFIGYGRYRKESRKLQWWHLRLEATSLLGYNGFFVPYITTQLRLGFHKPSIE